MSFVMHIIWLSSTSAVIIMYYDAMMEIGAAKGLTINHCVKKNSTGIEIIKFSDLFFEHVP